MMSGATCSMPMTRKPPSSARRATPDNSRSSPPRNMRIMRGISRIDRQSRRICVSGGRNSVPMNNSLAAMLAAG